MREVRCFGPPGTGKTTWLAKSIADTVRARGSDAVVVGSFTRTAAAEISGRNLPIPDRQIGTLHSLAYRAIDQPELHSDHIGDWNARHHDLALTGNYKISPDDDTPIEAPSGGAQGDRLMRSIEVLRARMVPVARWPVLERFFYDRWSAWKTELGVIDFTDMIETALETTTAAPGNPLVGYFDEFQDFTPLEIALVRHWGEQMETLIVAGDDDQCQPPGTMVSTTTGPVPIEELNPATHRLVSMDLTGGSEIRRNTGYEFSVTRRHYTGRIVNVVINSANQRRAIGRSSYTPDHRCLARWRNDVDLKCVYLMRRGNNWRLGTTDLVRWRRAKPLFGPGQRCRQEGGDAIWVLSVHERDIDARFEEARLGAKYGLVQTVFNAVNTVCTQAENDRHHDIVARFGRPDECLVDHGMTVEHPLWESGCRTKFGPHSILRVRACNLIPEAMVLPVDVGRSKPDWQRFARFDSSDSTDVFSLNVEPHHTYIADGIVTRNCLYHFKGATPEAFLNPPVPEEDKRVLRQSWRVPAAVHRYAEQWIKQVAHREPKVYTPRDEEGSVVFATDLSLDKADSVVSAVIERIDSGQTVMLLTSCAYLLEPVIAELRRRGVPFGNQYRESRSQWNPLGGRSRKSPADRLDAYLVLDERIYGERSRLWTGMDIAAWGACLRADGVFKRGVKTKLKGLPQREMTYEEVADLFASPEALEAALEPSLAWFRQNISADKRGGLAFPLAVAENRSPLELTAKPRVTVGTVHSVKGGEADSVFVFPDLSMAGMKQWESIQLRDSVIRQMYVAFTRPRFELVICEASTDRAVDELTLKRFR